MTHQIVTINRNLGEIVTINRDQDNPTVTAPAQTLVTVEVAPRGFTGPQGERGERGEPGLNAAEVDPGDFTLVYENGLV